MVMVDVEALAGVKDLSEILHAKETTVGNWAGRREWTGFPEEVHRVAMGPLYDKRAVIRWYVGWSPQRAIPKVGWVSKEDMEYAGI